MNIVVTIAGLDPESGGPSRTVPALCSALAREGAAVHVVTVRENRVALSANFIEAVKTSVIPIRTSRYDPFSWRKSFYNALERLIRTTEPTVLYDVGLWLPSNHFAAATARKHRIPFVSSPRGMLSEHALGISKVKKKLAWTMYQRRDAQSASAWHATSQSEANDIRAQGLKQPIAIIPNGVDVPKRKTVASENRRQRTMLFLSRLHPIKGLKDLIEAWARLKPNDWRVIVAGPDESNYRAELEALVGSFELTKQFDFIGPVADNDKWNLYGTAELFVLPSYSESFGQVIGEALASAVPVITTKATPWSDIEAENAGWWINTGVDPLTGALCDAVSRAPAELRAMGERGRELIQRKYSWSRVAKEMKSLYEWLLGLRDRPSSVVTLHV
jgi:glycosyltransferase involved in cell wall biosynthesis